MCTFLHWDMRTAAYICINIQGNNSSVHQQRIEQGGKKAFKTENHGKTCQQVASLTLFSLQKV